MRRETCGSCQSTDLIEVLDLGTSPLANEFPTSAADALAQARYPLGLATCATCSLLQLTEVVVDEDLWNREYTFYTGASWPAVLAQREYADDLLWRYRDLTKGLVLEIACNDGSMLSRFKEAGCRTLCVDPAIGPTTKARQAGLDVIVKPFGLAVAHRILQDHGYADLIVANNVIAHIADLDDFIAGLAAIMAPNGRIVVEFQYAADLVTGNMIDLVYHEHRSFFTLTSLGRALHRHDLKPLAVQQTMPQGGSLRVHIGHMDEPMEGAEVPNLMAEEEWLSDPGSLRGMQGQASRIRGRLLAILEGQRRLERRVAGYGASAKSTTLLNFCGIGPDLVQYFVDSTPVKQWRFTPGTGIPIIDPRADSRAPDIYFLSVHNYAGPIMRKENFAGQWLVPIPIPILL